MPSRPGCLTIEVVVGKTPTGGRLRPATEFFALSLTREDHFRTVFRYSPPNTPRKYDGYKGKPQWHRCCLAPQQDRGSTFRLSKNIMTEPTRTVHCNFLVLFVCSVCAASPARAATLIGKFTPIPT